MKSKILLMLWVAGVLMSGDGASQAATADFCGYTWVIRSPGKGGPGPNHWEPNNVLVDTNGYLHLRLTHREGKWYCSEAYTKERFGFGRYEFWIQGQLDRLDRNVVLGLFTYPTSDVGRDGMHEIDIEFAKWGNASAPIGNYTVWPTTNGVRRETKSFTFKLEGSSSYHSFTWNPTAIIFHSNEGPEARNRQLASWHFQPANAEAHISQKPMPIHINLWCFKGQPPTDGQPVEIIVRAFKFTPM